MLGASWLVRGLRWAWSIFVTWRETRRLSALLKQYGARSRRTRTSASTEAPKVTGAAAAPAPDTPDVARFNENASNYLFEQYGVFAIPAPYWTLLDEVKRPVDAFARFVRQLGLDVDAVRNRSEQTLARLRDYCEFLFLVGDDISFLDRMSRVELARLLASEDHEAVRGALSRIERARLILGLLEEPASLRSAGFDQLLVEARQDARDPIRTSDERLGELHEALLAWRAALASAAGALGEARAADASLSALLRRGARLESAEDHERRLRAREVDAAARRIQTDATLSTIEIERASELMRQAAAVFDRLRVAAAQRQAEAERRAEEQARKRRDEEKRRQREKAEQERAEQRRRNRENAERDAGRWRRNYRDVDEALAFFGFARDDRPKWSDIHRRFVKMRAAAESEFATSNDKSVSDRMRDMQSYYLEALKPNRARFD